MFGSLVKSKRAILWCWRRCGLWRRFLFLKPFIRRCRLMVIGLQSAPVMALIWDEDRPVSWRTAIRILRLSASEIFLGLPLDFFLFHNPEDLLRTAKWSNLSSDGTLWEALFMPRSKTVRFFCLCHQEILTVWQEMAWNPNFCTEFGF